MPQKYINAIKESSLFVLGKVLKDKKIEVSEENQAEGYFDISATISLSNENIKILVSIGSNLDSAKFYAKNFLRMKIEPNEELINSSLSELTNIVIGDAKKRLEISDMSLGLPQLVQGNNHRLFIERKEIEVFRYIYQIEEFQLTQIIQIIKT